MPQGRIQRQDGRSINVALPSDFIAEVAAAAPRHLAAEIERLPIADEGHVELSMAVAAEMNEALDDELAQRLGEHIGDARPGLALDAQAIRRLRGELSPTVAAEFDEWYMTGYTSGLPIPVNLKAMIAEELDGDSIGSTEYGLGSGGYMYPTCKVTKSVSPKVIGSGEYTTVTISVDGDEKKQSTPVPKSVVITLDESGSMESNSSYSRAAAKAVVNELDAGDKVALVTFGSSASVVAALTTDHASVLKKIDQLGSPSGSTNMLAAFDKSNDLLIKDTGAFNKMVILFSDGVPSPLTQIDDIKDKLDVPLNAGIHYFCVGYLVKLGLQDLAEETGGEFYEATKIDQLVGYFKQALATMTDVLLVRNVVVKEVLASGIKVRSGSFNYSQSQGSETKSSQQAMAKAEQAFYSTGTLTLPSIPLLGKGRNFTFHFDVTAFGCQKEFNIRDINDTKKSYVDYSVGNNTLFTLPMPPAQVSVKACGVYWTKKFDATTSRVVIEIQNTFTDRKVYDIHVAEITGPDIALHAGTAQPGFPIAGIYYPSWCHDVWTDWGVEWDWSYIDADTTKTFSVEVHAEPSAKGKSPVVINPEWDPPVIDIEGTLPEPKTYGFVEYWYKDDSGKRVDVKAQFPELTVPKLDPKWPYI